MSSSPRPSSSHRPMPRSFRERNESAAASITKPSTCSVRSFPPSTASRSTSTGSASGAPRAGAPRPARRSRRRPRRPSRRGTCRLRPDEPGERRDEHRVVVQRRRALQSHAEAARDGRRALVDVEQELDVVGDEPDRNRDHVAHAAAPRVPARCSPRSGPAHGSGVRPADWYAHDQRSSASPARSATSRAVSRHCSPYGSPDASTRSGRLCALKTTWTRSRSSLRPAGEALLDPRGERLDEPGRVVVARDVLELDAAAVELEPVGHLLLVPRDRERAEVRREHEAHRALDAVIDHLADDLLDPRRPVTHAEVAAVGLTELLRQRVDLPLRHLEQRRAARRSRGSSR